MDCEALHCNLWPLVTSSPSNVLILSPTTFLLSCSILQPSAYYTYTPGAFLLRAFIPVLALLGVLFLISQWLVSSLLSSFFQMSHSCRGLLWQSFIKLQLSYFLLCFSPSPFDTLIILFYLLSISFFHSQPH